MTDISLERTHSQTLCATTNVFMYYKVQHRLIVFLPQWLSVNSAFSGEGVSLPGA